MCWEEALPRRVVENATAEALSVNEGRMVRHPGTKQQSSRRTQPQAEAAVLL